MTRLKIDGGARFGFGVTHTVTLILLICSGSVRAQTPSTVNTTEQFVEQQVRAGNDVVLENDKPREIRSDFLATLLETYQPPANRPSRGIHITNAEISGELEFHRMTIPYWLVLENCTFKGDADFTGSRFQKGLSLRGSVFEGQAIFYQISVDGELRVNKGQFKKKTNLDDIRVSGTVHLYQSKFHGDFTLANSEMDKLECAAEDREFGHAEFRSGADFYSINVKGDASFTGTSFEGPVDFGSIDIGKNLEFSRAQFTDQSELAGFFSMRVGRNAIFNDAKFLGGFDFGEAEVTGRLEFNNTQAINNGASKKFSGMRVGAAVFDNSVLVAPYDLDAAEYEELSDWSQGEDVSLELIRKSNYSRRNYTSLESYYRKKGLENAADQAYIAGRERERNEAFGRQGLAKLPEYLGDWILSIVAGYGKKKERALVWSAFLIVIGFLVFRKEKYMQVQKPEDASRYRGRYHPLWYSIALFLPIVNLEDAKIWTPKVERKKSRFYMRLHIILGYLLIPIGLAAWTGLIK